MLKHIIENETFVFWYENQDNKVSTLDSVAKNNQLLASLQVLQSLIDNGFATTNEEKVYCDIQDVLSLDSIDKKILFLPNEFTKVIYIESSHPLNDSNFNFKLSILDFFPNGKRLNFSIYLPFITIEDEQFLLSRNQYDLIKVAQVVNSTKSKTLKDNLKSLNTLKKISINDSQVVFEEFLKNEAIVEVEKLKIDLEYDGDNLILKPLILGSNENSDFIKNFDLISTIRDVYPVRDTQGKTKRIIIDEDKKQVFKTIKEKRLIKDPSDIERLIQDPEYFLSNDVEDFIDLDYFSQRVIEIGFYKPKFYPFIRPYKSEWIPGIIVKHIIDGEKRIELKSLEALAQFIEKKEKAIKAGFDEFEWEEEKIPVKLADEFIEVAQKQLINPRVPVDKSELKNANVLIIKENAETLEYEENVLSIEKLEHRFQKINNLNKNISLKNHQIEGVSWLQSMFKKQSSGCLLADDMGLGKTLQILYFLEWHSQNHNQTNQPYLIVAPVSLLENWGNEFEKFFTDSSLNIISLYNNPFLRKEYNSDTIDYLNQKSIFLTNYETVRAHQFNICAIDFSVVILDEAQKIKTPGTLITNVCKALKSDFKIAMTGTPVENTSLDLWCIMDFTTPGLLGNAKDFSKKYQSPLKDESTDIDLLGEDLRTNIGEYIKRRYKKDVLADLPLKKEIRTDLLMPEVQMCAYLNQIAMTNEDNSDNSGEKVLKAIWAIKNISDHPYLHTKTIDQYDSNTLISTSAKLQLTIDIIYKIRDKQEKVIIFTERKDSQKMLQKVVSEIFHISASIINGETPSNKQRENAVKISRQQTIDRFQSIYGFNVIIMSQLAAGVGLNVTDANHVIHFSRHWNPAKEEQATDRVYRIGQTKDVYVYYPQSILPKIDGKDIKTFDQVLDDLLNSKKQLASSILFPSEKTEVKPDELFGKLFG